ncbi:glutamine synthetase [Aneurinibacillus soli]|uniref:Glutamine synthetase n=1 Tax=Aneurinibacillus soli TaxID=1500254 RepID=A0A0U4WGM0_9BACL|nr:glutamine synthetase family protein [Aneurinibacillus soli]PYE61336.1 glutamine synthetase [Aneurinibacillus soli]BAU27835.1 Glutamine synthetase [Aneurinibacillus soli]
MAIGANFIDNKKGRQLAIEQSMRELEQKGVKFVRLLYSDIHGFPRGKDIPLEFFPSVVEEGQAFCYWNIVDGLDGSPLHAPEMPDRGYPDMKAIPDLSTLAVIPWEKDTVQCLADLVDHEGRKIDISPRQFLKKVTKLFKENLAVTPILAHELEFYLLQKSGNGWERYSDKQGLIYTVGYRSDERGLMQKFMEAGKSLHLQATAANHEHGGGQFEVNMLHGESVAAADRAFSFKNMIKEVAACNGLMATFMGKPFTDQPGSGFHLHLSLVDQQHHHNIFSDPSAQDGISKMMKHFMAGVLHHAPALTAFLAPTINAYKRLIPNNIAPVAANWGYDNRHRFIRIPPERGSSSRMEIRGGDGAANPYLISAVCMLAGYDGIIKEMELQPETEPGKSLPRTLTESLEKLHADKDLCDLIGNAMVMAYTAVKRTEIERYQTYVTDWELNEYVYHL